MNFPTLLVGQANPERDARREFDLFLDNDTQPSVHLRVCHVVTTEPFVKVALAAYRAYPNTLKKLEVPGWVLTDGTQRLAIADLQQAMRSKGKTPESARARTAARERLGMEA